MTSKSKKILFACTSLLTLGIYSFVNKVNDLKDNVKFFINKFRVHGIVNTSFLRVFTTVSIFNQAQSTLAVNDLQVYIQYLDGSTSTDIGASAQSTSLTVLPNQSLPFELGTDLNLLTLPYDKLPGLLDGKAIKLRVTSSFTAFGKRITVPTEQSIQLPSLVIYAIKLLLPKK